MAEEDKAFSSIDFVGQCLVDKDRTIAFQKAINKILKKNDSVLELGTGSGIMSVSAAKAGAKKVYAVEFDPFVAEIAQKTIENNNFTKKVKLFIEDARNFSLSSKIKFNVVISELLTTGMVDEPQIRAINNLHDKKLVDNYTVFLPSRHDTYISLANSNFSMFGLQMSMILHLWKWHNWKNLKISKMTDKLILNSISFNKKNEEKFESILSFEVKKAGVINSLYLTSRTFLTDKIFIDDTEALNAPMLVPIPDKVVKKGQKLKIKISYIFGGGYKNFNIEFLK